MILHTLEAHLHPQYFLQELIETKQYPDIVLHVLAIWWGRASVVKTLSCSYRIYEELETWKQRKSIFHIFLKYCCTTHEQNSPCLLMCVRFVQMPNWALKHAWINSLSRFCPVCTLRLKRVLQPPATHTGFECLNSFWCQWLSCSHQGNCWDVGTWWHD